MHLHWQTARSLWGPAEEDYRLNVIHFGEKLTMGRHVKVPIDCQRHGIYSHLGDRALGCL